MDIYKKFVNKKKNSSEDIDINEPVYDQIVQRNYDVTQENLSKLFPQDLIDIINKYDDFINYYISKSKKTDILYEESQHKEQILQNTIQELQQENEQYTIQVQEIQKHLNNEMTKGIQLQQDIELLQNQNNLLKEKIQDSTPNLNKEGDSKKNQVTEDFESKQRIVMDPDSQLLLFTNENELQNLRNYFELIESDAKSLQAKLKEKNLENTEEYVNREKDEEDDEEDEYTVEDLFMNCWDSLENFNDNFKGLKDKMDKFGKDKDTITQQNKDQIEKLNLEIAELQNQLQNNLRSYRDTEKQSGQLENDFIEVNKRFSEQKEQNMNLEETIQSLNKQLNEKQNEIEEQQQSMKQIIEEKISLKEEIGNLSKLISDKEQQYQNVYQQEMDNWNQDYDELEKDYNDICEKHKKSEENFKDLESKFRQEQLKTKSLEKEQSKLEEKFVNKREELSVQIQEYETAKQKLISVEMKRAEDKKKIKDQKNKILELQQLKSQEHLDFTKQLNEKNEKMEQIEGELMEFKTKQNIQEEVKKQTLQKDMKLSNFSLVLENTQKELKELKEAHKELLNDKQRLELNHRQKENMIKSMNEKKQLALAEINRLTVQIQMMKNCQNPQQIQKIKQIEQLIDKADKLNSSFSSEQNYQKNQVYVDSSPSLPEPVQGQFNLSKQTSQNSNQNNNNDNILQQLNLNTQQSSTSSQIQMKELRCLQMIMEDLQKLYKDYIMVVFSIKDNQPLVKFEKRFNDSIKKAQDLMDTLEDQLE